MIVAHPITLEIAQLEREDAAWRAFQTALGRKDKDEASRCWREYARVKAGRSAALVELHERERGLA